MTARILDLCTGSGCIAAAIARHLKDTVVVATDVSAAAVAVARRNIERLGLAGWVVVEEGDGVLSRSGDGWMCSPLRSDRLQSTRYILTAGQIAALDRSVRAYEPRAGGWMADWTVWPCTVESWPTLQAG